MTQKVGRIRFLNAVCPDCRDGELTQRGDSRYYTCSACGKNLRCKVCAAERSLTLHLEGKDKFCECKSCTTKWFWDETPLEQVIKESIKVTRAKAVQKALDCLCAYCGGGDVQCPHCAGRSDGYCSLSAKEALRNSVQEATSKKNKCPNCNNGALVEHKGKRTCLLCQAEFPSSLHVKSTLEEESERVSVDSLANSQLWNTPCPQCKIKHKIVQFNSGELHCIQCGYDWSSDQKMLKNNNSTTSVKLLGKPKSKPLAQANNLPKVECPSCQTEQSLDGTDAFVECTKKGCDQYFPVSLSKLLPATATNGVLVSPEDYERVEELLLLTDDEIGAFKRFQDHSDDLESLLDDVLTYGSALKDSLYRGENTAAAFVDLEDTVERLLETHSNITQGYEDGDNAAELWAQQEDNKWKEFDDEQKNLAELVNEVTIEDVGGDLADGETVASALPLLKHDVEMDDEYEDNDDDRTEYLQSLSNIGKCHHCGGTNFDHEGYCFECSAHFLIDRPCNACGGSIDADGQCIRCYAWVQGVDNVQ